jgi:hypothetical protein
MVALIRQNGAFTWMYGHYGLASKQHDGISGGGRSVADSPERIWVSTESNYVKLGIMEWIRN